MTALNGVFRNIMVMMGFLDKWSRWIMECVLSVSYSVLINGSPSMAFQRVTPRGPALPILVLARLERPERYHCKGDV